MTDMLAAASDMKTLAFVASAGGPHRIVLDDVDLVLPDGRRIVETERLELAGGESVALSGPSGCPLLAPPPAAPLRLIHKRHALVLVLSREVSVSVPINRSAGRKQNNT
jgi:hypothetical protein